MIKLGPPKQSAALIAIGGLLAMAVGIGIGRFVYTPILPPMMIALGLSKTVSGVIASANFAGYLAGAVAATRATLPGRKSMWLPGALLMSAATTVAMGLTSSVAGFVIFRFLGGAASALVLILSSALVLDRLAGERRTDLAPLHFAGVGIGIAASAALVAMLSVAGAGWASMWWASGALSLLGAVAVAVLVPAEPSNVPVVRIGTPVRHDPRLWRMIIAYGLFGFGYVITATFLVAIVRATPAAQGLEPIIWVIVGLAAAPSVLLWTSLARRVGTQNAFAAAALTEAVGVLASVVWPGTIGLCAAAVLLGGTFMGLTALGLMSGRELAGGDPRRTIAMMTGAFSVGQIVGPALSGVISDALGGFAVPSLMAAAGLIVAALLARR